MITGCNTNVRYRGVMFHIQTEDSGRKHPHVISHLYHGGTIIVSQKSEYADRVDSEDLEIKVRALMELQHKEMVARLKRGEFNSAIADHLKAKKRAEAGGAAVKPAASEPEPAGGPQAAGVPPFAVGGASEKPLDELILDYLVEKARGRETSKPPRASQTKG